MVQDTLAFSGNDQPWRVLIAERGQKGTDHVLPIGINHIDFIPYSRRNNYAKESTSYTA